MKDYPRKALMITWLTYFAFAIYQLFSNDALVFPSPINTLVIFGVTAISVVNEFKSALKFERLGLLMFLFSAIIMFLSDSFMMSIFLDHEIVNDWFSSSFLLFVQNLALLALLSSLLVIAFNLSKIKKYYGLFFALSFITLVLLGFIDVNFEALFVQTIVGLACLILAVTHRQQITSATNALLYLWVIQVSIACFEYWNLNL
jgi:hypothetical protein